MKNLLLFLTIFTSSSVWANYQKPELLALSFSPYNFNLPLDSYCYLGTPIIFSGNTVLDCQRDGLHELMLWDNDQNLSVLHSTKNFISTPQYFGETLTWYEYDQERVLSAYQWENGSKREIAVNAHARSVVYLGDKWIYQSRQDLSIHHDGQTSAAQIENISYVFNPSASHQGDYAVKVRRESLANSAPDEIWSYKNDKWIKVFSDKDGDSNSKWLSFNNSVATGDGKVFVIAKDDKGEVLVEINDQGQRELVRQGVDVLSFESFSIAYNGGGVVFRGIDFSNRKAIYVHNQDGLKRVLTQGDTVLTPTGVGVVDYPNVHSIIYNNPGIGERGDVVIQATLLDFNDRKTLLGIGILSIKKGHL